ncbi:CoxD-like protein [Aeropyrum camini SY1 = JCM 12091]|uniref:CoxD-like protein n=2 Tax=Aeropyrum camini TaxID=229980 RepID=U3TFP1_9CREN|nr:CoxD-like protein [Aeropyrum camini SY1 = JCM 12091]
MMEGEWERFLRQLTPEKLEYLLRSRDYIPSKDLLMALYLALKLGKPLLVEGEPGNGKTELAKVLAEALGTELIRLQCYEGIDASQALYDWNYPKQLLAIRMLERSGDVESIEREIYSEKYLVKGPLLRAVTYRGPKPPVLLIDEVDRADEEFEAFLLEFLAEFQVTVPEIGTFRAEKRPIVIITSNRTREVGEGLRRRCLYVYVTYPPKEREVEIVMRRVKGVERRLVEKAVDVVARIRASEAVLKKPGVSETIDWVEGLRALGYRDIDRRALEDTVSCLFKAREDLEAVSLDDLLGG